MILYVDVIAFELTITVCVVFLQAVMHYMLMYIWLLVLSTGVTSAALWQHKTVSDG